MLRERLSTEKIFVEFNLSNSDLTDYRKLLRWAEAGTDLNVGPFQYEWVADSGEIPIGTFEPGGYVVGGFFQRSVKSYEPLVRESFEVTGL